MIKVSLVSLRAGAEGVVLLESPYHPDLPLRCRELGGQFSKDAVKGWLFMPEREAEVRKLTLDLFGTDDFTRDQLAGNLVAFDVYLDESMGRRTSALWAFGRCLVQRREWNNPVIYGMSTSILVGGFPFTCRLGETQTPLLGTQARTVLRVGAIPKVWVERWSLRTGNQFEGISDVKFSTAYRLLSQASSNDAQARARTDAAIMRAIARKQAIAARVQTLTSDEQYLIRQLRELRPDRLDRVLAAIGAANTTPPANAPGATQLKREIEIEKQQEAGDQDNARFAHLDLE